MLVGIGISMILYIIKQSNQIVIKRRVFDDAGNTREIDAPDEIGSDEVVVLQPYGSLFFASAPVFEEEIPNVTDATHNSVVILRLRGRSDLGTTFMDVLYRYAEALRRADSKLVLVSGSERVHEQLAVTRVTSVVGEQNIYMSGEWVGKTLDQAYRDARAWVEERKSSDG